MKDTVTSPRSPDLRDQEVDPTTCEVMPGHQHAASDVEDLADSLAALGQLNPVQILEYPDGRRYIAAGRRRWMACVSRGLSLRADVWLCTANEDVNSENLARAIRIAENTERKDPSAMDVAFQLRRIRVENNFASAAELGAFVGMSESRVKRYLCVLQASDFLMETARTKSLPITVVVELMRCEKLLGERTARKFVKQTADGCLSAQDLKKVREKTKNSKKPRKPRKPRKQRLEAKLRTTGDEFLALVAREPKATTAYAQDFVRRLTQLLENPGPDSKSSLV